MVPPEDDLPVVTPPRSPVVRWILVGAGFLCIGLGALGIILPVLPTTPFMLVAAACFARASPRFYRALLGNRVVGPSIRDWRRTRTIRRKAKIWAIVLVVVTIGSSVVFFVDPLWGKIAMSALALAVITLLVRIPTRP